MIMTNRAFAFLVAGLLVASPLYVFANEGEDRGERTEKKEHNLLDFRANANVFGGFGNRGDNESKSEGKNFVVGNAEASIDARIDNLERLIDRIEDSERLSSDEKARMIAGIEAQIDLLEGLQTRIENGESRDTIKADLRLSLKGKMHAMPKAAVEAAAERVLSIVDRMETLADRLEARINEAEDNGEDVSVSVEAHADLVTHLATASAEANAAIDLIADLDLDSNDDNVIAENRRILIAAKDNIEDAYEALKAAREEVRLILVDLDIEVKDAVE